MLKRLVHMPRWIALSLCAGGLLCVVGQIATWARHRATAAPTEFFDERLVHAVQIRLGSEEAARLNADGRTYVSAKVRLDGLSYAEARIHLKGHGSFRTLAEKPSLTVDFGPSAANASFPGSRKIHLNNSVEDGSFLREWVGSKLFRAAGVPAPRVTHALVQLNGRRLGLYVVKEGFTHEFLARNFSPAVGRLYELPSGQPELHAIQSEGGRLQELAAAAQESDLNRRWERLHQSLDLNRFISYMAMEVVTCHWDGYSLARNNYRVYEDPGTGKETFLPTGMDQLFGNPGLTWEPHMAGLVARSIMDIPQGRAAYRTRLEQLLRDNFDPEQVRREIAQRRSTLCKVLSMGAAREVREEAERLTGQVAQRYAHLTAELTIGSLTKVNYEKSANGVYVN
jgi:hypothetical protein